MKDYNNIYLFEARQQNKKKNKKISKMFCKKIKTCVCKDFLLFFLWIRFIGLDLIYNFINVVI